MKGLLAWIIFVATALTSLYWIGTGVRDNMRERAIFQNVISQRIELSKEPGSELVIGLAGDWDRFATVRAGAERAAEELNESGGVMGRQVRFMVRNDHGVTKDALAIAHELALIPEVSLVLGHTTPQANAFVIPNYEFYSMLLFSPNAAVPEGGRRLNFSNALPADQLSQALLDLAGIRGWKRVGLIYDRTAHHETFVQRFESLADSRGVAAPLAYGFKKLDSDLDEQMTRWNRELNLDAMVLALAPEDEFSVLRQLREQEIDLPVVLTAPLPDLAETGNGSNVLMLHPYAMRWPDLLREAPNPDQLLQPEFALGYESMILLARACERSGSIGATEVAEGLRTLVSNGFPGGTVRFLDSGEAVKLLPRFMQP